MFGSNRSVWDTVREIEDNPPSPYIGDVVKASEPDEKDMIEMDFKVGDDPQKSLEIL